ncbi:uncharacterized protein si:dkey-21c1.4 [Hoplias malabaricus]|uniref:uncharacterized protein si:dkey-21c1.4 n=1 Tax=Hoplias malabaricus TaxID=27720 RepID=UPI0034622986
MTLEQCPFCGKPFKRLKSHLPHCKMSPGSKATKNNNVLKQLVSTSKDTSQKDKKNKVNVCDKKLNKPLSLKTHIKSKSSMTAAKVGNEVFESTIISAEGSKTDTMKTKSKWLAKREKEMEKAALSTLKGAKITSDCLPDTSQGHIKGEISQGQSKKAHKWTTLTSLVKSSKSGLNALDILEVPQMKGSKAERSTPNHKANVYIVEDVEHVPKPLCKDLTLVCRVKDQRDFHFFQTKTCVWDHIKHAFYKRSSDSVPILNLIREKEIYVNKCENTPLPLHEPHVLNYQKDALEASSPLFSFDKTPIHRPSEYMIHLKQSQTVMEWTPDMATGYCGNLFSSSHSGIPSKDVLLAQHQSSSIPIPRQGAGREQSLGDVRLCELAAWLRAQIPKSPRETATMLNKGWQWYYRKYIDVQKGGVGGIAMLIAGYCVLSYIWSYPHLKKDRWRYYH